MSKKKKIIIAITSFALVNLLIIGIAVTSKIQEIQSMPKFVDEETEQQVRYILNMPTGDISTELYNDRVWSVTSAFGHSQSVWPNADGLYTFGDGSNDVPPPPEEYMDEEYLEFALWLYTHQTGETLAVEEIEKLVTEGNIEKKAEIDAYVDWHNGGGGAHVIEEYATEYDLTHDGKAFIELTLEEKQAFVLDEEDREKQEEQENSTNE